VLYCLDIEGHLTLSQVKNCSYVERQYFRLTANHKAVMWVKVKLENPIEQARSIAIHVAPHQIKSIELFDGNSGKLLAGPIGTSFVLDPMRTLLGGYTFSADPKALGTTVFFLRIVTAGIPFSVVTVSNQDHVSLQRLNQQTGIGIHLGMLALLLLASVSAYVAARHRVIGCFALVILNLLLSTLSGSGFLFVHFWGDWPRFNEIFFSSMFYLRLGLWVLLAQTFLDAYKPPRWYRTSCRLTYLLVAFMLLLSVLGYSSISNGLLLFLGVTLVPVVQILAIQKTRDIRPFYRRVLFLGFAIGAALVWATLVVTLLPTNDPSISIVMARIVDYVNPLVLLLLVVFHYRETTQQLSETKQENLTIRLGLEFERKLRDERKVLVDMLTHELKNPLASINMAVGSLAIYLSGADKQIKRRLHNIAQSVAGMDMVIERSNLMNQLDQNALRLDRKTISLRETFESIVDSFSRKDHVLWHREGDDEFITDPYLFETIFSNLIENALKYSPSEERVEVSVGGRPEPSSSSLVVTVTNAIGSQGFPDQTKIFSRFYRNPLALNTRGSGVGLFLVRELTQLLGGEVNYQKGATTVTFTVVLPEVRLEVGLDA